MLYTVTVYATVKKKVNHMSPCFFYIATVLINLTLYLEGKTVAKYSNCNKTRFTLI